MTFRFAEPSDAAAFAEWAAKNPQIAPKDITAATKEQNPTATVLVIERDGAPVLYVPVYLTMRVAYLGFNPESDADTKRDALEQMLTAVRGFAQFYSIHEIDVLTKAGIPIAEWARAHGFEPDDRELWAHRCGTGKAEVV